jgi:phenylpyruvate tautomerase PptA (4-oxalocrotonate tautomerase family)
MPLVRIDFRQGKGIGFGKKIGDVIYQKMHEVLNVPDNDKFQVITEHAVEGIVYDPNYLGISRTDGVIFIQIVLNEGRTVEMKQKFYRAVADGLHNELGIRTEDVLIVLVEVKKENWSFGNGIAQYA